jgi:lambda repressor-like predicted transcriptional regulator
MSQGQISKSKNSTVLAARIFHSMRPLIEAAIGMMPEEATAKKLMKEFQKYQAGELKQDDDWREDIGEIQKNDGGLQNDDLGEFDHEKLLGHFAHSGMVSRKSKARRKAEIGMKRGRKPQTYLCNGEEKTLAEWSKVTGLSYGTLVKRLSEKVPLDAPKGRAGRRRKITLINEALHSKSSSAKIENDSEYSSAISAHPGRRPKLPPITIQGKTQSIQEWSRDSGLSASTIMARLARGWSPEKAITHAPMMRGRRGPKKINAIDNNILVSDFASQSPPRVILRKRYMAD